MKYMAHCDSLHWSLIIPTGSWTGDCKDTYNDAKKDADDHNKDNEGHAAGVLDTNVQPCPD
jgi:hypothetical protein